MTEATNKGGRPSKFDPSMCKQVTKLCRLGATDKELADFFEVSEATLNTWKQKHPEFLESLKKGKDQADAEIAHKLYHRAKGYTHPEEKIFCSDKGGVTRVETTKHYAPDTTACIFWLKNRRSDLWRDRHEHTGPEGGPIQFTKIERRIVDPSADPDRRQTGD